MHNTQEVRNSLNVHWQINKENAVYAYGEILFSHKKKEIQSYAEICMNIEDIMLLK